MPDLSSKDVRKVRAIRPRGTERPTLLGLPQERTPVVAAPKLGGSSYYVTCSQMDHVACGKEEHAQWTAERIDHYGLCSHAPHRVEFKV